MRCWCYQQVDAVAHFRDRYYDYLPNHCYYSVVINCFAIIRDLTQYCVDSRSGPKFVAAVTGPRTIHLAGCSAAGPWVGQDWFAATFEAFVVACCSCWPCYLSVMKASGCYYYHYCCLIWLVGPAAIVIHLPDRHSALPGSIAAMPPPGC